MPGQMDFDVAIVGYGPVSQTLTGLLAKRGHKVVALERYPTLYGRARAGHIDGEIMRVFQTTGVARQLELLMRPITSYELVSAEGDVLQTVQIGRSGSGWKSSYLLHQPELEEVLDANARAQTGVEVLMGFEVVAIDADADGVTVKARKEGGEEKVIRARYLVGCDGANSFVRGVMGASLIDLGFEPYDFLVIDFEHNNPDRSIPTMGEVRQVLDPKRPTTAGRWNGNQWSRWEFMRLPHETREQVDNDENCWRLLKDWGITPADGTIVRRTLYTFQSRICDTWRKGRLLLAGDAAHTMPPFMAQGLCAGARDASNLSWKLDLVLKGKASESLLDTYQTERQPHVTRVTEMAMEIGRLVTVTDPDKARARDAELRSRKGQEPHGLPNLNAGLLVLSGAGSHPAVGQQSLQARVHRKGQTALLDDLTGSTWRLVSRHPLPQALREKYKALLTSLNMQLVHVTRGTLDESYLDIDAEYDAWFRANGAEVYVERPDYQIAGAVKSMAEVDGLLASLGRALKETGVTV